VVSRRRVQPRLGYAFEPDSLHPFVHLGVLLPDSHLGVGSSLHRHHLCHLKRQSGVVLLPLFVLLHKLLPLVHELQSVHHVLLSRTLAFGLAPGRHFLSPLGQVFFPILLLLLSFLILTFYLHLLWFRQLLLASLIFFHRFRFNCLWLH
jgi:hypothetical protein